MKAFLDACVLFPSVMREMLVGVAAAGLYEPLWSPRVLEEWALSAARVGEEAVARGEIALLNAAWPKACVVPRDSDIARLHLPDPADIHVLAAAAAGSADLIITLNAKDFPRHTLSEEGLSRQDPDAFLRALWAEDPEAVGAVASRVFGVARVGSPGLESAAAMLKKARLPRLAKAVRRAGG